MVRKNIEKKEDKREKDKIGKETRTLQVPCRSEAYSYNVETTNNMPPGNYSKINQ